MVEKKYYSQSESQFDQRQNTLGLSEIQFGHNIIKFIHSEIKLGKAKLIRTSCNLE